MSRTYDFTHWNGAIPKVSCLCATYGRPHLLGEAIEAFLRQDYIGDKELIILNDHPDMPISIPILPFVKLINSPVRFKTLGEKRNAMAAMATGDIFCTWDDDDISLPWRISMTIEKMTNHHYFKPSDFWWWAGGTLEYHQNVMAHPMAGFSRELFEHVGGYPEMNSGEDQIIEQKFKSHGLFYEEEIGKINIFYIYRFNYINTYHISGHGFGGGWDECEEEVRLSVQMGLRHISVGWNMPYDRMVDYYQVEKNRGVPRKAMRTYTIIILILSDGRNSEERQTIRETWLARQTEALSAYFLIYPADIEEKELDVIVVGATNPITAGLMHIFSGPEFDYVFVCNDQTFLNTSALFNLVATEPDMVGDETLRHRGYASIEAGYLLARTWVQSVLDSFNLNAYPDLVTDPKLLDQSITQVAMRAGALPIISVDLGVNEKSWRANERVAITCRTESLDGMRRCGESI